MLNACRRHGSVHNCETRIASCRDCAQRLSASWIGSPIYRLLHISLVLCSTPVGVMDRFTSFPTKGHSSSIYRAQRLSASWIGSQYSTPIMLDYILSAQRLSASWIGSPLTSPNKYAMILSAQRLSASWIGSRVVTSLSCTLCRVLNACRRHGSVHIAFTY